ncbi:DUF2147 domain-containing protein [Pedobacter alpinus]|uniref:DUF2147 domain-containing protein n=1 Tax=Pedobacter alpinus TaxID=1590643 RepID=A0ABW5TX12_9SPHI
MRFKLLYLVIIITLPFKGFSFTSEDDILGRWISTKKNVIIEVYKSSNQFKAKVIWFDDRDDIKRPMRTRLDIKNPDKDLKNKRILGMDVLERLSYNPDKNRWDNGLIYDPQSGKHWSSLVYFNTNMQMIVKGYWKFEFLCQTLTFNKFKN